MFERFNIICKKIISAFFITFIFSYLSWHLVNGKNGILAYFKEKSRLETLTHRALTIESKRDAIKNKVERLYPKSLDADLLDEQYRRASGKVKPNEFIYYYD
ncbi:MAG: septum formation initiator family protein [Rickettsiales bacterium]|nr:septum formation initiator family protein [Rickettsiales bacterium]